MFLTLIGFVKSQTQTWDFQGYTIGQNATGGAFCNEANMPEIQKIGSQYILYYTSKIPGNIEAISYATSPDLITWTVQDTILTGSSDTTNREYILGGARVIKTNTGQYRMFYRCAPKYSTGEEPKYHIRSAISSDGINFTKEGVRIEIKMYQSNSFFTHVGHSAFYVDQNGNAAALLTAKDTTMTSSQPDKLYTANSPDQGLTWSSFTLLYGECHDPVVAKDSTGLYHAFFSYLNIGFRTVTSTNGITWPLTSDTLVMKQGTTIITESSLPGIADLGAAVNGSGTIYLYSNYHAVMGPWTNIANFSYSTTSGVNEHFSQVSNVSVYPNPSSKKFTIELSNNKSSSLEVYNKLGQKVFQSEIKNQKLIIDLTNHTNGLYFIKIYDGTNTYTKKIIFQ